MLSINPPGPPVLPHLPTAATAQPHQPGFADIVITNRQAAGEGPTGHPGMLPPQLQPSSKGSGLAAGSPLPAHESQMAVKATAAPTLRPATVVNAAQPYHAVQASTSPIVGAPGIQHSTSEVRSMPSSTVEPDNDADQVPDLNAQPGQPLPVRVAPGTSPVSLVKKESDIYLESAPPGISEEPAENAHKVVAEPPDIVRAPVMSPLGSFMNNLEQSPGPNPAISPFTNPINEFLDFTTQTIRRFTVNAEGVRAQF